jgi:hypothetical protein
VDSTVVVGIAGIVATLGGVWLGSFLSKQTARDLAEDQRKWEERHAVRQRQDEEAAKLDERLLEALAGCPSGAGPARETAEKVNEARSAMLRACSRGTVLDDPEILARVWALAMVMMIACDDAEIAEHRWRAASGEPQPVLNPWPITVGIHELRESISCFQRHVDPPPANLPKSSELVELGSLDKVRALLVERRAQPMFVSA